MIHKSVAIILSQSFNSLKIMTNITNLNISSPRGGGRGLRTITLIVIHCSATVEGKDYTVEDIDRWHKARGFNCQGIHIGYHYVIYLDGSIHQGRPEWMVGAHVKNHNQHSIGICYIGGLAPSNSPNGEGKYVPKDTRTPQQKSALLKLLTELKQRYPKAIILGHRDLSPDLNHDGKITQNEWIKSCPSFDAIKEYSPL